MNQSKKCTNCNIEKEITEFHKQTRGKYGVTSQCKVCNYFARVAILENQINYLKYLLKRKEYYYE